MARPGEARLGMGFLNETEDEMGKAEFTALGTSPLLTHSTRIMAVQSERAKGKGKWIPTPQEEADLSTYRTADDAFGVPAMAFRGAIVKAGGAWPVPGQRMSKMGSRLGHIDVGPTVVLPLLTPDGEPIGQYEIDIQRAVVQRQGVSRARARFDLWRVDFEIEFDDELVPGGADYLKDILSDAGKRIGVCDFRPEKKGPYGRFRVL